MGNDDRPLQRHYSTQGLPHILVPTDGMTIVYKMSTTHPTDITTEWDDLQRKHGNLPKLPPKKTNEERDAEFVELVEAELLRETRLAKLKKKLLKSVKFGTPVPITHSSFVSEVTESSKCQDDRVDDDLKEKFGNYIPVLLLRDGGKECNLLKKAWEILARRHVGVKFTIGSASSVLKSESGNVQAPSSILLYYGGTCILQKGAAHCLENTGFDIATNPVEHRVADSLERLLNGIPGHSPLKAHRKDSDSDDESDGDERHAAADDDDDDEDDSDEDEKNLGRGMLRSKGHSGKAYTSWIIDRALEKC